MKENELREHSTCSLCNQKIGHTQLPLFYVVTVAYHGIKMDAVKRQDGLTALLGGNTKLALAMGPDEDLTQPIGDPVVLTVCQTCATEEQMPIAAMIEDVDT